MTELELTKKRRKLVNEMMDIALTISAADDPEEIDSKHEKIKKIQSELDLLPTINDPYDNKKMGRPAIGEGRSVKVTMPADEWEYVDNILANGIVKSLADYFRICHYFTREDEENEC